MFGHRPSIYREQSQVSGIQPWFAVLKLMFHLIFLSLSLYFLLKVLKCFMASVKLIIKPKSETTRHQTSDIIILYYTILESLITTPASVGREYYYWTMDCIGRL